MSDALDTFELQSFIPPPATACTTTADPTSGIGVSLQAESSVKENHEALFGYYRFAADFWSLRCPYLGLGSIAISAHSGGEGGLGRAVCSFNGEPNAVRPASGFEGSQEAEVDVGN
jgi:hypothetical protein